MCVTRLEKQVSWGSCKRLLAELVVVGERKRELVTASESAKLSSDGLFLREDAALRNPCDLLAPLNAKSRV